MRSAWHGRLQTMFGRLVHGPLEGGLAAILAYLPSQALGLKEGFWAAITAIAVMQSEWRTTSGLARDQLLGAAIGGIAALATLIWAGNHLWSYGLAVAVAVAASCLIGVPTAGRLAGVTATIVLLVPFQDQSAMEVAFWRGSEVAWGAVVAVSLVWLVGRVDELRRPKPAPPG